MKHIRIGLILLVIVSLLGCGAKSTTDGNTQESTDAVQVEETMYPVETIIAMIHIDPNMNVIGTDEIPEEYFSLTDAFSGSKGLKVFYGDKVYSLYLNGTVRDSEGNDKRNIKEEPQTQEDALRAWARVLKRDDYLGEKFVLSCMTVDATREGETVVTLEEAEALFQEIEITKENIGEYFGLLTEDHETELTGSSFEENYIYITETDDYLAYIGEYPLVDRFVPREWEVVAEIKYDEATGSARIKNPEEYGKTPIALDWFGESSYEARVSDDNLHKSPAGHVYLDHFTTHTAFLNSNGTLDEFYRELSNFTISNAKGTIIVFTGVPEEWWSYTESGEPYLVVDRGDAYERYSLYGKLEDRSNGSIDEMIARLKESAGKRASYDPERFFDCWIFDEMGLG